MLCLYMFKKFKRLRLFEPSLSILGFVLVIIIVVSGFCLLDYKAAVKGLRLNLSQTQTFSWLRFDGGIEMDKKIEFLSEGGEKCDIFEGDWVWDENYPLYQSRDCRFIDDGFRCSENGRPDFLYTKWRWQPKHCNLPRFDAKRMLEKLRNKRVVFAGDSIGRNQWESLLCMLSSAVSNKDSIYEVNGNPITKHKGFLVFKFSEYNCTVEYYRAPFLVLQSRPLAGVPSNIRTTLKLDQMDWSSSTWKNADVLVLNTGHWWNYGKTIKMGCYFQEGSELKMEMDADTAYKKSLNTILDWISREVDTSETQVFFRTYAPAHFRFVIKLFFPVVLFLAFSIFPLICKCFGYSLHLVLYPSVCIFQVYDFSQLIVTLSNNGGDWRNGGKCDLQTLPELGSSPVLPQAWRSRYSIFVDVMAARLNKSDVKPFDVLDITRMTTRRRDGHLSRYYLDPDSGPAPLNKQDCSHWCLPGVPDTWNELLYALFLKHNAVRTGSSSISPAQA